jgi:hypothetical protein
MSWAVIALVLVCGLGVQAADLQSAKPANRDATGLAAFVAQAEAYVALQKKLGSTLDITLTETASQAEIASREKALGDAVRRARSTVKRGSIFNDNAARVLRRIVRADYRQRTGQKKRLQEDEVPEFQPVLNQAYPSTAALATFPATLLAALPKLPEPLEYRLVSNHLILRDIEANIIVDYVPNIIP